MMIDVANRHRNDAVVFLYIVAALWHASSGTLFVVLCQHVTVPIFSPFVFCHCKVVSSGDKSSNLGLSFYISVSCFLSLWAA